LPHAFSKWDILYWQIVQTRALRYTQRIICISNHTRADVNKWLDYPPEHVITIFPAVQDIFKPLDNALAEPVKAQYGLCEKFILYVGGLAQHKNLRTLIKAFSMLKQSTQLPHKLVIVGGQYHTHNDMQAVTMAQDLLKEQVVFTGMVPDKDIPALYSLADAFVFPTLYEGFGLAPLEAMACGTPVIASRVGSLPEVLDQAALWVDTPLDEQAFATAIIDVLQDPSLRSQLSQKGIAQAHKFSWAKTAAQTMAVYESLIGKPAKP
jgi:glycosyltransferase involved in cell wall biosynthesis